MAHIPTTLEHYNLINCDYVVCDTSKMNSLELLQTANVETPFYFQQGQYIVSDNFRSLENVNSSEEYVIKEIDESVQYEVDQSGQTIIYCTPEQYAEYLQVYNKDRDQSDANIFVDGIVKTEISVNEEMDNIQVASVQDLSELEDSNESDRITGYLSSDELLQRSNYQYAILKDGQLHLKALNIEDEQKSYLKEQLEAFQASISFDGGGDTINNSEITPLDLDKITGKNLITGQTVTLGKYMNKLLTNHAKKNYINKRVVIGKTSSGRKLVGKIVHVQKGETKNVISVPINKFHHNQKLEINPKMSSSNIDIVGNILADLMNWQNIHQKLNNKVLVVKLFTSTNTSNNEVSIKNALLIQGHMKSIESKWHFLKTKIEDCKMDDYIEFVTNSSGAYQEVGSNRIKLETIPENAYEFEKLKKVSDINTLYIALLIVINKDGKTITKVHFSPDADASDYGFEVHIYSKLFGCDECFKIFKKEMLMVQHKKIHHVQRWFRTICSVCNKSFTSTASLRRHFLIHDQSLRLPQCTVCLQQFRDQSNLKKHLLIHTGIRSFVCNVCRRSFINQADLNFHSRIHDPVKLFNCTVCGREFSRQSNLMRHSEIHRGEGALYQCQICGCSYSFSSSLTRHIVHKHLEF